MMTQFNYEEKLKKCVEFFDRLTDLLAEEYESVGSCNADVSRYLIPKGSIAELTYMSKPKKSFRISDHWNWYSNLMKNPDPKYIQCFSVNCPWANKRSRPDKASYPIKAIQVGYFDLDDRYHAVFGESFDRKTHTWTWIENDPEVVAAKLGLI